MIEYNKIYMKTSKSIIFITYVSRFKTKLMDFYKRSFSYIRSFYLCREFCNSIILYLSHLIMTYQYNSFYTQFRNFREITFYTCRYRINICFSLDTILSNKSNLQGRISIERVISHHVLIG